MGDLWPTKGSVWNSPREILLASQIAAAESGLDQLQLAGAGGTSNGNERRRIECRLCAGSSKILLELERELGLNGRWKVTQVQRKSQLPGSHLGHAEMGGGNEVSFDCLFSIVAGAGSHGFCFLNQRRETLEVGDEVTGPTRLQIEAQLRVSTHAAHSGNAELVFYRWANSIVYACSRGNSGCPFSVTFDPVGVGTETRWRCSKIVHFHEGQLCYPPISEELRNVLGSLVSPPPVRIDWTLPEPGFLGQPKIRLVGERESFLV